MSPQYNRTILPNQTKPNDSHMHEICAHAYLHATLCNQSLRSNVIKLFRLHMKQYIIVHNYHCLPVNIRRPLQET